MVTKILSSLSEKIPLTSPVPLLPLTKVSLSVKHQVSLVGSVFVETRNFRTLKAKSAKMLVSPLATQVPKWMAQLHSARGS